MPKVVKISRAAIPHVEFVKGMKTYISVCEQTVGSENLMMGACYHDADMDDLVWDAKKEESFFVAKGRIKLLWENAAGERGEVTAEEGEEVYLPVWMHYILRATGEPAINVFAAGGPTVADVSGAVGPERATALKNAGEKL